MEKSEKNNQPQEFKGRNLEDVISLAEHVLKLPREQFDYEIVAEKTKLFGIKSKEIVIRAQPKAVADDRAATEFLDALLTHLPLDIKYYTKKKRDILYIIFEGEDKRILLRKDGSLLLAIQHLLNKVSTKKVQTDCDFFRQRKEQELRDHAQMVAQRVHESGEKEILDFMNPYERRIVHVTVNQIPGITSESLGDGFLKRMKIIPVKD
ncbi:MAG: Jag N-terminal domain-containing protein [Candidatus Aminicenantes bacterium]|nr:Jag N-terminal domain-containing protein [Candidatus Aminicenantes bacterium]